MDRRKFLRGAGASLLVAPAIVSVANIMPIVVRKPEVVVPEFTVVDGWNVQDLGNHWYRLWKTVHGPDGRVGRVDAVITQPMKPRAPITFYPE